MRHSFLVLMLAAGCEKDLLADMHDAGPDAEQGVDAQGRCAVPTTDAHPAAMHTLYINFDGVTLTPCGMVDSRQNCTDLVNTDTTFPPFMDGNPVRDSYIGSIVNLAWKGFQRYSIDIVTTRPPSGDYYMMVVGGTPALVGAPANVGGIAPAGCSAENRNLVSLIFDSGQMWTQHDYANSVLSDLAMIAGLPVTTGPMNDCACRSCSFLSSQLCTYGESSPVTTDPMHSCGQTTADEPALLQARLGCRQ